LRPWQRSTNSTTLSIETASIPAGPPGQIPLSVTC
jgi:hypothetical protein